MRLRDRFEFAPPPPPGFCLALTHKMDQTHGHIIKRLGIGVV